MLQVILLNADRWRSDDGGREFFYFGFQSIYVDEFTNIVAYLMNGKNANLLQH
jgi:hypothetical protein